MKQSGAGSGGGGLRRDLVVLLLIIVLGSAVRMPFLLQLGHLPDMASFVSWAMRMQNGSLSDAYRGTPDYNPVTSASNYPPAYLYVLRASAATYTTLTGLTLQEAFEKERENLFGGNGILLLLIFRLPAVLADLGTAILLYYALRRYAGPRAACALGLLYVLQPGVIYNSSRWGQVDAIHTFWMVACLELAIRRRYVLLGACGAVALLFKFQAIVLMPVWLMCLLFGPNPGMTLLPNRSIGRQGGELLCADRLRRIGASLGTAAVVFLLICMPFLVRGAGRGVWRSYAGAVGHWPVLTANAFNLWGAVAPLDTPNPNGWTFDNRDLGGFTLHTIGFGLLAVAACVIGVRCLAVPFSFDSVRWAAVALCLVFFTFPTQIHERYLHPVLAVAAWAFMARWWWWVMWAGLSYVYAVNLAWVLPFELGWPGELVVSRIAAWQPLGCLPSQFWGLLLTVITFGVLLMPLPMWRRTAESQSDLRGTA